MGSKRIFGTIRLRRILSALLLWQLLASGVLPYLPAPVPPVEAASARTLTSRLDFERGYFNNTESKSKEGEVRLKPAGNWGARSWKTPNRPLSDQSPIVSDGKYIYTIASSDNEFMRYIPAEDRWQTLARAPHYAYAGSSMTLLGNYIYTLYGGYQRDFGRYNIATDTWETLANTPDLVYQGASLATDGTNIWVLRGTYSSDFWKYNPATNVWTIAATVPNTVAYGAGLVYYSGNLYAMRGYGSNTVYRYNIAASTWYTTTTDNVTPLAVVPATLGEDHTITIKDDNIFLTREQSTNTFYRYNITSNTWFTLAATPQQTRYVGVVYNAADDYIYVFRGNGQYDFWKYNPTTDTFAGLPDLPNTPGTGADLLYDGGYVYYPIGRNTQSFYRYNTATGVWSTLANTPATFNDDVKATAAAGLLYFFRGGNTNTFYSYNPGNDTWDTSLPVAPVNIYYGGGLIYPGAGDYLYALRGNLTRTFMRYSISGKTWDDAGAADLPDNAEAGYGARMATDGPNIYYVGGNGISTFLKYTIATNTWTVLGTAPFSPYYGTDLTYYNGRVYAQAGLYKTEFWEYAVASNTWRRLPDYPSAYPQNIGPWNGGSLEYTTNGNFFSISGQGFIWMYQFTASADNYSSTGTWTSETLDLNYVSSWGSLSTVITQPGDSSVTFETRSSADRTTWSAWEAVSGGTIASPANRYLEVRASFTASSGNSQTPSLAAVTVNYTGDETAPGNPSTFAGYSQEVGGTVLTSGIATSYPYANPYFTWSGASDTETGIAGYYVYFGPDAGADPAAVGTFQTETNYISTLGLSNGSYYLRLRTKDKQGNTSTVVTGFIYSYGGVSPVLSFSASTSGDFATGSATNVSILNDRIKLASRSGFWQQERLRNTSNGIYQGGSMAYVAATNKIYALRGYNSNIFYEYDIPTDAWAYKAVTPATVNYGGALVEGPSGFLYAFRGINTPTFWRYSIATDTWDDTAAADPPAMISYGANLIYDGSRFIYALKGNNDDLFMRYDTQLDLWETLANTDFGAPDRQTNNLVYEGGNMAYDGDDSIYALQGGTRSGFAYYSISANSWTVLPNLPALPYNGSQISFDAATNAIYYLAGWDKPFFYKYDINTQGWTQLPDAPAPVGWGGYMRNVNGVLYAMRGAASNSFWKFNIAKNSWLVPAVGIFNAWYRGSDYKTFYYGADIVKGDGNDFFIERGNYDNVFVKYNSATGEVTELAPAPAGFYVGAKLVFDSVHKRIYATPSIYDRKMLMYDVATDVWTDLTTDLPPTDTGEGTSMAFDGARYIYWIRGGATQTFYRFDTQAAPGAAWGSALANTPASMQYGAELVVKNDYVYALRGYNQLGFYRYGPLSGTPAWNDAAVADLPAGNTIYNDGFLVDAGPDKLIACRGANTATCFAYSVSGNTWTQIADAPAQIYQGGAAASDGVRVFVIAANGTNTFNNGLYTYVLQTDNSSFQDSGSYISPSHDLNAVYRFTNLDVTYTSATNSGMSVYTRTSEDNSDWSVWALASEGKTVGTDKSYKINSPANRYIQVRFDLVSGDGVYSGAVEDYTVYYHQDLVPPVNPSFLSSYATATQSSAIASATWYNYPNPNFDWPDAETASGASDTDTGSGVAGYYVYFGTNNLADPATDGTFATPSAFTNAAPLVSGSTYYLRIRTKDNAGNASAAIWTPFTYKFDNEVPANPVTISVNPPGYSTVNNYSFTLKGATDAASLISGYCYKYKTGEETYSGEICVDSLDPSGLATISGITAYAGGEDNTFYVRAKDFAGNYNPAYATQIYKYSANAPSRPDNLRLTWPDGSDSNTKNEFAFAWDPPVSYVGQQAGLKYYYWINEKPSAGTAANNLGLSVSYLSKGAFAQRQGKNTLYVVAEDEAGNIDYGSGSYASVDFYSDTTAPGAPTNLDISDVSIKETSAWRLALSWDQPTASGSGIAEYRVYRSETASSVCPSDPALASDFTYIASTLQTSYVDTGLTQDTKYYCVLACNYTGGKGCGVSSDTVHLFPDGRWRVAPTLVGTASATVKTKSALITWSTNRTSNSFVKYGKKSGDYGAEVGSSTQTTYHEITLTGLDPGTAYYYKEFWTDEDGNMGSSKEMSLTTNPAPSVSSVKISNVSIYSAQVTFTVSNAIRARIEYGKTLSYGGSQTVATSKTESSYTITLEKLTEGTPYHLRLVGEDDEGNVFAGDDYTFQTLPVPKITALKVQQVAGLPTATLRVLWTSNTAISSIVTYYPSGNSESARDQIVLAMVKGHEAILRDLKDDTEYTIIVKGRDAAGNEAAYPSYKVKTAVDFRPPEIANMIVESTIVGVGDEARAQVIVSWDTDEPSTTQIEYAQGTGASYNQTTQEDSSLTTNHTVTIPGLSPARIYHLRAVSKDKAGNVAQSPDTVTITPKSTKDALNLVIDNLSKTFGFLKGVKGM